MDTEKIIINGKALEIADIQHLINDLTLPEWELKIYRFILDWFNKADFILQKTSGSTGEPKEIQLKKSAMIASARNTINFLNLQYGNTAWLCLPIDYIAGKMMVVRTIVGNMNLLLTEPTGTPEIPVQSIDFTAMIPLQIQNLIDANSDFNSIQKLIIGGAAINFKLQNELQSLTTKAFATYGMTETCSHIALQLINGTNPENSFQLLPGISISKNEENCLQIDAPELNVTMLQTTDLVEIVSEEKFIWLGRADNVINSGGIKILPEQLEHEISQIIRKECLVIPMKDAKLGQKLVLVLEGNIPEKKKNELFLQIKLHINKHRCPKEICNMKLFPRKESMKIDRQTVIEILSSTNES